MVNMNKSHSIAQRITRRAQHPLVLHLRRRRLLHGEKKLGQAELAALAGISVRQLRLYETSSRLPRAVANLLALALIFDVHIEDLVAESAARIVKAGVAQRRQALNIRRCRNKK